MAGVIALDFDGTLHSSLNAVSIEPACFELLAELRDSGYKWGINTGRSYEYLMEGIEQSNFPMMPDFIISREREVFFYSADSKSFEVDERWRRSCVDAHDSLFKEESKVIQRVREYVEHSTNAQWVSELGDEAGMIAESEEEMDKILAEVNAHIKFVDNLEYLHSTIYMRFTHREFHKGTSLQHVARRWGYGAPQTFAMGDGPNDLGMLDSRYAGMLACPANAVEVVKHRVHASGGFVAEKDVSFGVIGALEYFFK